MSQTLRPVPTASRSYSCTVFKNVLQLQTFNEILCLGSVLNKHYEFIKSITEHNASKTPFESTMLENYNVHAQDKHKRLARFPGTAGRIERRDKTVCGNNELSSCAVNGYLWLCNEIQGHARKTPRGGRTNNCQECVHTHLSWLGRLTQLYASISNENFNKSGHSTSRSKARSKEELIKENNTIDPVLTNTFLQKLEGTASKTSYRTNENNTRQTLEFEPHIYATKQFDAYLVPKNTSIQSTNDKNHNVSKSTTMVLFPEMDYSKHNLKIWRNSCTLSSLVLLEPGSIKEKNKKVYYFRPVGSITTNLSANPALSLEQYNYPILSEDQLVSMNNKEQTDKTISYRQFRKLNNSDTEFILPTSMEQPEDQKRHFKLHAQSLNLKLIIGPYAQMHIVYNVKTAERGTSQVFKQKSQGIGTSSMSSNGTSSTATSGRPAIQITSSCSFRIELPGKGSGPVIPVQEEPVTQLEKPIKARKKTLHRCLCTLSFPTDKKKKELPAHAAQTKKEKITKEERQGKETFVKEKGSASISKYKETVEVKEPLEKKKVNPCVKCCKNFQKLWKKDKDPAKELKPGITGTNISLKPEPSTKADKKAKKKEEKELKKKEKKEKKEKKKGKKGRTLKPYECEPGVCSPKVCVPQECYDRKFPPPPKPPPPKPPPASQQQSALQKCCRKLQFWKKETGPPGTGTQAKKKSDAPPAGATVYKDSGAGTKRGKLPKLDQPAGKTTDDTSTQPSAVGGEPTGDFSTGPQFKKQGGFSGVQFYQSYDSGLMTKQKGVNIGSECGCSLEFYKMHF